MLIISTIIIETTHTVRPSISKRRTIMHKETNGYLGTRSDQHAIEIGLGQPREDSILIVCTSSCEHRLEPKGQRTSRAHFKVFPRSTNKTEVYRFQPETMLTRKVRNNVFRFFREELQLPYRRRRYCDVDAGSLSKGINSSHDTMEIPVHR